MRLKEYSESEKYEKVKEEFGYNDEDIRALSKSIKMKVLGFLGPAKDQKLTSLMIEQNNIDKAKIKEFKEKIRNNRGMDIKDLEKICKNDLSKWIAFADLGGNGAQALFDIRGIYENNDARFEIFAAIAKQNDSAAGTLAIQDLAKAKNIYEASKERFEIFAKLVKEKGYPAAEVLADAKGIYLDDNKKLLMLRNLLMQLSNNQIGSLTNAKGAYGNSEERFKIFVELAKEQGWAAVLKLADTYKKFGGNDEKFKIYAERIKKGTDKPFQLQHEKPYYYVYDKDEDENLEKQYSEKFESTREKSFEYLNQGRLKESLESFLSDISTIDKIQDKLPQISARIKMLLDYPELTAQQIADFINGFGFYEENKKLKLDM